MKVMERYTVIEQEAAVLVGISALHKNLGLIERPEYALLRQINEYGMVGITELADEFHLEWDTIFDHIQWLKLEGLIVCVPNGGDDVRISLLRVTELGLRCLKETQQMRMKKYNAILEGWSNKDLQKFGELLSLLNRQFAVTTP